MIRINTRLRVSFAGSVRSDHRQQDLGHQGQKKALPNDRSDVPEELAGREVPFRYRNELRFLIQSR